MPSSARAAQADSHRALILFGDVFEQVRAHYVGKPDDGKLIESTIDGMLNGLDPHSSYIDRRRFRDMEAQTRGEFGGLGIEVTPQNGFINVVLPDTPAAKAGIRAGDMITHIDDEPVQGLTLDQAVEKMREPRHSVMRLRITHKGKEAAPARLRA
jgi:carboxyl-terminal processing protease